MYLVADVYTFCMLNPCYALPISLLALGAGSGVLVKSISHVMERGKVSLHSAAGRLALLGVPRSRAERAAVGHAGSAQGSGRTTITPRSSYGASTSCSSDPSVTRYVSALIELITYGAAVPSLATPATATTSAACSIIARLT